MTPEDPASQDSPPPATAPAADTGPTPVVAPHPPAAATQSSIASSVSTSAASPVAATTMSFGAHLDELRYRMIIAIIAVFAGFGVCCYFSDPLLQIVLDPIRDALTEIGEEPELIATGATETFMAHLEIALVVGAFLGSPVVLYQAWRFVGAGLFPHEQRYVLTFAPISMISFVAGTLFFHYLFLPWGLQFLLGYGGSADGIRPMIKVSEHLAFFLTLAMVMGGVFQLPLVMLFVFRIGIVTPDQLAGQRKIAVLACFVIGALITPPDVVSQLMMTIPLILLYEIGLLAGRVGPIRPRPRDASAPTGGDADARINPLGVLLLLLPSIAIGGLVTFIVTHRGHRERPKPLGPARSLPPLLAELAPRDLALWCTLANDPDPEIRLVALRRIAVADDLPTRELLLRRADADSDPSLRLEAARLLAERTVGDERRSALERLVGAIEDSVDVRLAYLAHRMLCRASGAEPELAYPPTASDRAAAAARWRAWIAGLR